MSLTADSALFDSAVRHLFHLPETLEKLGFPASAVRPHDAHRGNGRGRNGEEGVGLRSAPVDILESHKEYTFVIDVPGLSKSDIQVRILLLVRHDLIQLRGGDFADDARGCR